MAAWSGASAEDMSNPADASDRARAEVRALIERRGHAVEVARDVAARLEQAFSEGALVRTPFLDRALSDLAATLDQGVGGRLGGKSGEASRLILRAVDRALDEA